MPNINHIFCVITLLCLALSPPLQAQPDYYFKQVSLQEGLSQSSVKCIYRDHKELLWIGTRNGLNRYDGYELKSYFNEKGNPGSVPDNQIQFVTGDSLANLWVATSRALVLYDRENDKFVPAECGGRAVGARSFLPIKNGMLFAGGNCFWLYDYTTRKLEQLPVRANEKVQSPFNRLVTPDGHTIWAGTRWSGLWIYDMKTGTLEKAGFYPFESVAAMCTDSDNNMLVSPYGEGIFRYSPDGRQTASYNTANSTLNNNVVLDLIEKDKQLWIATDGGGINILDYQSDTITAIEHIAGDPYSLPVNTITCFYKDNQDVLWVGSHRGGMLRIKNVSIRTYRDVPLNNSYGLSEKTVICLHESPEKDIWIGTDGGGINRLDPQTQKFTHYPATNGLKVASIIEYSPKQLLISCFGKGLSLFDKATGKLTPFTIINQQANQKIITAGVTINLLKAGNDKIYLLADKVYVYTKSKQSFHTIVSDVTPIRQSGLKPVRSDDSTSWLFGEYDIFELRHSDNRLTLLYHPRNNELLEAVCRDSAGQFWFGTNSGLNCYNPATGTERHITTQLFNSVSSLTPDAMNRLWIGARNMLYSYNISDNKFVIFGESDGVQPNELLSKPTLVTSAGNVLIGGVAGLVMINKEVTVDDSSQPEIELFEVLLDGKPLNNKEMYTQGKISIPWNHSSLLVKTTVKEKDFFREKRYRYQINELNSYYVETDNRSFPIGSLQPGSYTLNVQCNTRNGDWTPVTRLLTIEVTPPWWRSIWFSLLCLLALLGSVLAGFMMYAKKKENRHKWEMQAHDQKIYEQKVQFLINISHELRTPLTLIYAPLKRIIDRYQADKELAAQLTGVYKQARQMKNIINMVLDVRKMESGQNKLQLEPLDLNNWVKRIAGDFENEFDTKGIRLTYQLAPALPQITFDPAKCEIVLSNLLINALKFSSSGTTVKITTSLSGDQARVAVADEGIGLRNIDPKQLFKRFYQGNHDRGGSGIGLSYAKLLVEMHGGSIGAHNNAGAGATFWYELPTEHETEEISFAAKPYLNELLYSPAQPAPETSSFSAKNYSLLIVEDEPELRQFVKESLKEEFKHIYTAEDGVSALRLIQEYHPDAVVSDVMMPRMDGYELCRRIKEDLEISHIPVILLTARSDSESTTLGYKTGADYYLAKPFEIDFLSTIICNQLKNRERIKAKYRKEGHFTSPEETTFSNADEKFLQKLNTVIETEIANPNLNVDLLVDKMALSRASLYNKVKILTDMGVNDYIIRLKIQKACHLLATTELSILEISEQTGFTNQRYFSTIFKQMQATTPTAFRKQQDRASEKK